MAPLPRDEEWAEKLENDGKSKINSFWYRTGLVVATVSQW